MVGLDGGGVFVYRCSLCKWNLHFLLCRYALLCAVFVLLVTVLECFGTDIVDLFG